jgi:hypothetical protein
MSFRACASAAAAALLFLALASCSSQPAASCGTGEGTFDGIPAALAGCTFKWTCDANKPLEMRCARSGNTYACDCFASGILEKSFKSLDVCDRRRESGKTGCGWDVF